MSDDREQKELDAFMAWALGPKTETFSGRKTDAEYAAEDQFKAWRAGAAWARFGEPSMPIGAAMINKGWFYYQNYEITNEGSNGFGICRPFSSSGPFCYRPTVREAMAAVDADIAARKLALASLSFHASEEIMNTKIGEPEVTFIWPAETDLEVETKRAIAEIAERHKLEFERETEHLRQRLIDIQNQKTPVIYIKSR